MRSQEFEDNIRDTHSAEATARGVQAVYFKAMGFRLLAQVRLKRTSRLERNRSQVPTRSRATTWPCVNPRPQAVSVKMPCTSAYPSEGVVVRAGRANT